MLSCHAASSSIIVRSTAATVAVAAVMISSDIVANIATNSILALHVGIVFVITLNNKRRHHQQVHIK